jgi:hypothetical protein
MSVGRVPALEFPPQEISAAQTTNETDLDESVEFGDVSAETREMLEADFFASLRGGVA